MMNCLMLEITNKTSAKVPKEKMARLARAVLLGEKKEDKDISVVLLGPKEMQRINKQYREKEYVPNVLSFAGEGFLLGEIALCPAVIRKDAKEYGITNEYALCWMFLHGVLHVLGRDHATNRDHNIMSAEEQHYLSLIFL